MPYKRSARVGDLVRKELADLLLRKVKDPRVAGVTITGVEVSPDLHHAKIFYCVSGSLAEKDKENASKGLSKAKGYIRQELGKRLQMRYVPEVDFRYDPSFEYGDKIERLLKELHKDEHDEE
ncbi:MAG: 30S ribosome-binding factor RbfA [Syntrophobacteraceae bacterium]|nr:30S ribosome-binding factor RbfA [Syntrophobacteraceae bacterium]